MHRRAFLGWLAKGAALAIVAPTAEIAALFPPAKLRASATGYVRAWLVRNPGCRRAYLSRALFEALEDEIGVCERFTGDDSSGYFMLMVKGVAVIEHDWLDGWQIVDSATWERVS